MDATGYDYDTLNGAKWVSQKIELSRRRENLSWSHHREVAPLEPPLSIADAAKDPGLINSATEFKLRCERRLGELLAGMKEKGEIRQGHNLKNVSPPIFDLKKLEIEPHLSSRAQQIAKVPEDKFERVIAEAAKEWVNTSHMTT